MTKQAILFLSRCPGQDMVVKYIWCHLLASIKCSVLKLNKLSYESTMEVLEDLGEETMQAFMWQLGTRGVVFAPDSFNLTHFASVLRELLGDGSESLLEEIYQNILCRIELMNQSEPSTSYGVEGAGRKLSAIQKIQDMFGE